MQESVWIVHKKASGLTHTEIKKLPRMPDNGYSIGAMARALFFQRTGRHTDCKVRVSSGDRKRVTDALEALGWERFALTCTTKQHTKGAGSLSSNKTRTYTVAPRKYTKEEAAQIFAQVRAAEGAKYVKQLDAALESQGGVEDDQ